MRQNEHKKCSGWNFFDIAVRHLPVIGFYWYVKKIFVNASMHFSQKENSQFKPDFDA